MTAKLPRLILTTLLAASCRTGPQQPEPTKPVASAIKTSDAAKPQARSSAAGNWASKIGVRPGMQSEEFMLALPDDVRPEQRQWARRGDAGRVFTATFSDKSQIIATFRPRGGDGSGLGLEVYTFEIKE